MKDWFYKIFGTFMKESVARTVMAMHTLGRPVTFPKNYRSFADEGYKQIIAFRCINLIADAAGCVPWLLYQKRGRKVSQEIIDHPLLDLIERPNPMQAKSVFIGNMVRYLLISGNSFVEANGPAKNVMLGKNAVPTELWAHCPDTWQVVAGRGGVPGAYIVGANTGAERRFEVDVMGRSQVMHLKLFNPTDLWWGMSPIEAAAFNIDGLNEMGRWNLALLQNGGRPSGALVMQATKENPTAQLSAPQRAQLKMDLQNRFGGGKNAGQLMVLDGGLDWKEMGFSPKDMDWIQGKNTSSRDVALAFGVPPQMVSIPGDSTFNNWEQARLAFYQDTVLPLLSFIKDHFNSWLVPVFGDGLCLDFDIDAIDALEPMREKRWASAQTAEWLTPNEKRELTGYGRYESSEEPADMLFVQGGLIPIDLAASDTLDTPVTDTEDITGPQNDPIDDTTDNLDDVNPDDTTDGNGKARTASIDGKQFNLRSRAQRKRYWAQRVRKRKSMERKFAYQVAAVFRKEGKLVSDAVDGIRDPRLAEFAAIGALEESRKDMELVLKANIESVLTSFGRDVLDIGKSFGVMEIKVNESRFLDFVQRWVSLHVGERIKNIQATSRKRITRAIRDSFTDLVIGEGEGAVPLAKRIETLYSGFTKNRATTIARTEVHVASEEGSRGAAKALGVSNMKKEWLSAEDSRTRDENDSANHRVMDGVMVGIDEKFEVPSNDGVDLMDGPGDQSAPADQVINCRCTTVYSREKE